MRVIAGVARGRPLRAPTTDSTRPTGDKVKGAIFSMLEAEAYKRGFSPSETDQFASALAWPRVLDLYAGSGALGIEALSRGANFADLVDSNPEACRTIRGNLERTGLQERAEVHMMGAEHAFQRLRTLYGLVLLDPPYAESKTAELLVALARSGLVSPSSVIVVEHSKELSLPERIGVFRLAREKHHGGTAVSLYSGLSAETESEPPLSPQRSVLT